MTIQPLGVETVASPAGGQAPADGNGSFNAAIDALLGGANANIAPSEPAEDPPADENADFDASVLASLLLLQGQTGPNTVTPNDEGTPDAETPDDDRGDAPIGALPNVPLPEESAPGFPSEPDTPVLNAPSLGTNGPAPVPSNTWPAPAPAPVTTAPDAVVPDAPSAGEPPANEQSAPSPVAGPNHPPGAGTTPLPVEPVTPAPNAGEPVAPPNAAAPLPASPEATPAQPDANDRDGQQPQDPAQDAPNTVAAVQAAAPANVAPAPPAAEANPQPEPTAAQPSAPNITVAAAAPPAVNDPTPALAAPAVARAFAPPAEHDDVVVPQLVRAMRLQMNGGVGEARVQLEPRHLGAVSIALRVENGLVSAIVTAEQAGVRQWIEAHQSSLRQSLAEQGLLLERLQVHADGESPFDRSRRDQDRPARRRLLRRDNATFELVA